MIRVTLEYPSDAPIEDLVAAIPFIERHRLTVLAHGRSVVDLAKLADLDPCGWRSFAGSTCQWLEQRFAAGGEVTVFNMLPPVSSTEPTP